MFEGDLTLVKKLLLIYEEHFNFKKLDIILKYSVYPLFNPFPKFSLQSLT